MANQSPRDMREWMRNIERMAKRGNTAAASLVAKSPGGTVEGIEAIIDSNKKLTPAAPVELVVQTALYLSGDFIQRGRATVTFLPVTKAATGQDLLVDRYELWGQDLTAGALYNTTAPYPGLTAPGLSYPGQGFHVNPAVEPAWVLLETSPDPDVSASGLAVGSTWMLRVRAIGMFTVAPGLWSEEREVRVTADNTPPPQPTKPEVTSNLGAITVRWDGMSVSGPMPSDFLKLHVAQGEAPSPEFIVANFDRSMNLFVIPDAPYYQTQFFRFRAEDISGNLSDWSEQEVGVAMPLVDTSQMEETLRLARVELDAAMAELETELGADIAAVEVNVGTAIDAVDTKAQNALAAAGDANTAAGEAQDAATQASSDALAAVGIANGKGKTLIQPTAPAAADRNTVTLWIDTTGGANTPKRWTTGTTWVAVTDKAATDAAAAAATAKSRADEAFTKAVDAATAAGNALTAANTKGRNWFQDTKPAGTGHNVNDTWFQSPGNKIHRWNGSDWVSIQDTDIAGAKSAADAAAAAGAAAAGAAANALEKANAAQGEVDTLEGKVVTVEGNISTLTASVNGKNKIVNHSIDATGTAGYVSGDRWQKWTTLGVGGKLLASWRYDGTRWVAEIIDPLYLPKVDIGEGTFGSLGGDRLVAGSVFADKVVIGSGGNMFPDPTVRDVAAGGWGGGAPVNTGALGTGKTGGGSVIIAATTAQTGRYYGISDRGRMMPVTEGMVLRIRYWVKPTTALVINGAAVYLRFYDANGGSPITPSKIDAPAIAAGVWTEVSGLVTVPDGKVHATIGAYTQTFANTEVTFSDFSVQQATSGELIVDGSVTAAKVLTKSLTANEIKASSLTSASGIFGTMDASVINAGTLNAARLNATDIRAKFLAAGKVTAADMVTGTITATSGIIGSLDAAVIVAKSITGDKLAFNTVSAENLLVGDFTNLVPNGLGDLGANVGWADRLILDSTDKPAGVVNAFRSTPGQGTLATTPLQWSVEPDTEYIFEFWIKADKPNSRLFIELRNEAGANGTRNVAIEPFFIADVYPLNNGNVPTAWTRYRTVTTTNADTFKLRVGSLYFNHPNGTERTATVWIAGLTMKRRYGGELIVDGAVIAEKIAANAVTAEKIIANAITSDKILANAVIAGKIATNAVTAGTIVAGAVTTDKLDALAVTADKIAANTITANKLNVGSVTAAILTANSVTTEMLQADSITAKHTITGSSIVGATITGGVLQTNTVGKRVIITDRTGTGSDIRFYGPTGTNFGQVQYLTAAEAGWVGPDMVRMTGPGGGSNFSANSDGSIDINSSGTLSLNGNSIGAQVNGGLLVRGYTGGTATTLQMFSNLPGEIRMLLGSINAQLASISVLGGFGYDLMLYGNGRGIRIDSDGNYAFRASPAYRLTTTAGANLQIDSAGIIRRSTSASRYKLMQRELVMGEELLATPMKDWVDRTAAEIYAGSIEAQIMEGPLREDDVRLSLCDLDDDQVNAASLKRIPGIVAEEVEADGGGQFVIYGEDGAVEGVMYDRLALARTQILNNKLNAALQRIDELEARLS